MQIVVVSYTSRLNEILQLCVCVCVSASQSSACHSSAGCYWLGWLVVRTLSRGPIQLEMRTSGLITTSLFIAYRFALLYVRTHTACYLHHDGLPLTTETPSHTGHAAIHRSRRPTKRSCRLETAVGQPCHLLGFLSTPPGLTACHLASPEPAAACVRHRDAVSRELTVLTPLWYIYNTSADWCPFSLSLSLSLTHTPPPVSRSPSVLAGLVVSASRHRVVRFQTSCQMGVELRIGETQTFNGS